MSTTITIEPRSATGQARRGTFVGLCVVAAIALVFIAVAALPYLLKMNEQQFQMYWPRRWWLLLHITTGMVALLSGPVQLWLGLTEQRMQLHRRLGITYMTSVAASSMAAYYLAFNTDGGWVFGSGLASLATAWLITTGMAFVAIRRHLYEQHKEWMIRSYVVTTAFVSFRVVYGALQAAHVGTVFEQLALSSWFCWAVPLLVNEAILQGRKILAVRT
jgi:uncharacterized membrane protein